MGEKIFVRCLAILYEAVPLVLVLSLILAIHEYGHFSEMKRRGVEVEEFSIGIGPALYQYQSGPTIFSLRPIVFMAYVLPSERGQKFLESLTARDRLMIYSAGIRNNILCGVIGVFLLQMYSAWIAGWRFYELLGEVLWYPVRISVLWASAIVSFFFQRGTDWILRWRFQMWDGNDSYNLHINRFIWWSFVVGFVNSMPALVFDGSKIFSEMLPAQFSPLSAQLLFFGQLFLLLYIMLRGISVGEFINYEE